MHTYAPHYNYLIFNLVSNTVGLLNYNKTAWVNFHGMLTFPNQNPIDERSLQRGNNWPAAIVLH